MNYVRTEYKRENGKIKAILKFKDIRGYTVTVTSPPFDTKEEAMKKGKKKLLEINSQHNE